MNKSPGKICIEDNLDDLLAFYYGKYSYHPLKIKSWSRGIRYSAVMLENGNIGVCANLNCGELKSSPPDSNNLDLVKLSHRVWFQAYLNAAVNYKNSLPLKKDIAEIVDFPKGSLVVMVGLFKPVLNRLINKQIQVNVYDLKFQNITPDYFKSLQNDLHRASAVILTATSITNLTFKEILSKSNDSAHIYILGPSTVMDDQMFKLNRIDGLFGMKFKPEDRRVLEIIGKGGGTKDFVKFAEKVGRLKNT